MEHTPAAQIFKSSNYGRFHLINGNRDINQKKVDDLKHDINNGLNLLLECPVIVVEIEDRLRIIDGQHRFWTCKVLKLPVYYVISKNMPLKRIARMNSRTDKWRNDDYVKCFRVEGNENYSMLQDFMDKYHLPSSTALPLLRFGTTSNGGSRVNLFADMKQGTYVVKELDLATRVMDNVELFISFPPHKTRYFIGAIASAMAKGWNIAAIATAYRTHGRGLTRSHNSAEYETQLKALI